MIHLKECVKYPKIKSAIRSGGAVQYWSIVMRRIQLSLCLIQNLYMSTFLEVEKNSKHFEIW